MSKNAETKTTTHDDGNFTRTALVLEGENSGTVDVLNADGKFLARLNLFTKDDEEGLWFAVDVIDVEEKFSSKRALVFENGNRRDMETTGHLVATDFREKA